MSDLLEKERRIALAIENSLDSDIFKTRNRLNALEQAKSYLTRNPGEFIYEVTLSSLWADHGEKPVTVRSGKGLSHAIKRAQNKFKVVNNRSDVQARYSARAFIGRDVRTKSKSSILIEERIISSLV